MTTTTPSLPTLGDFVALAKDHIASYVCQPRKQQMLDFLTAVQNEDLEYLLETVTKEDFSKFEDTSLGTGDLPMAGVTELRCIMSIVKAVRKDKTLLDDESLAELHLGSMETVHPGYLDHLELLEECRGRSAQEAVLIRNSWGKRKTQRILLAENEKLQKDNEKLQEENAKLKEETAKLKEEVTQKNADQAWVLVGTLE